MRVVLALTLLTGVQSQHYFGGIGKNTWAANDPYTCIAWFQTYLEGAQLEGNECSNNTCACSQQSRVHLMNVTGAGDSYTPLRPFENASFDWFGVHAVNCSYHAMGECTLNEIERDFQAQYATAWSGQGVIPPLMEHNLGLSVASLDVLLARFEAGGVPFRALRWTDAATGMPYFSALASPCGTVLLEFISRDIGSRSPASFSAARHPRFDFDLPHNAALEPSLVNPLGLAPLKVSRATQKSLDDIEAFYHGILNASKLRRERFDDGAERLTLKMPDVSSGASSVHLQFWRPASGADVAHTPSTPSSTSCSGWTVGGWERYLNGVLATGVRSPLCGFPKVFDFHFSYDCVDEACVIDDVVDRLEALGSAKPKYRWSASPQPPLGTWWNLYIADPTGYGVETHFVHWRNPPDPASVSPGCFGTFSNGTCPGAAMTCS